MDAFNKEVNRKKLSLQQLFRMADRHRRNKIIFEDFTRILDSKGIKLAKFTLNQLKRLLSNPLTHQIDYSTYIQTLLAYNCLTQKTEHLQVMNAFSKEVPRRIGLTIIKRGITKEQIQAFYSQNFDSKKLKNIQPSLDLAPLCELKRLLLGIRDGNSFLAQRQIAYYLRVVLPQIKRLARIGRVVNCAQLWDHIADAQQQLQQSFIHPGQDPIDKRGTLDDKSSDILLHHTAKYKVSSFISYLKSYPNGANLPVYQVLSLLQSELKIGPKDAQHLLSNIPLKGDGNLIEVLTLASFLKSHSFGYKQDSNKYFNDKKLQNRVSNWRNLNDEQKGLQILKLVKRYLNVTKFTIQDLFIFASRSAQDPDNILMIDIMQAITKLIGRLSPLTLQLAFPRKNNKITPKQLQIMFENAGSYRPLLIYSQSIQIHPKTMQSVNRIKDLKQVLGKMDFDIFGGGDISVKYLIAALQIEYIRISKKELGALIGGIVGDDRKTRVSLRQCISFCLVNCPSSTSLMLEKKYLRYKEFNQPDYFFKLFGLRGEEEEGEGEEKEDNVEESKTPAKTAKRNEAQSSDDVVNLTEFKKIGSELGLQPQSNWNLLKMYNIKHQYQVLRQFSEFTQRMPKPQMDRVQK